MICISVIPCLSCGLAKNDKLCPCLSYFPGFFGHFESLAFFKNGWTNLTPKQSNMIKHDILVNS